MRKDAERIGGLCPAAAFLEDVHDFFGRLGGVAFADGVRVDLADACRRGESPHHGLVRREDDVVLVLPEIAGAFRFQGPDDFQRNVLVADGFADGVFASKEVPHDGLPNDADFCHAVGFVIEHHAVFDFVVADFEVVRGNAGERGGGVVVADNGLPANADHGRNSVDVGRFFADSDDVFFFEHFRRFGLHASAPALVRHDGDGVCSHGGHLFLDGLLGAFAHGDHGDDCRNTDDDAENGKECAHAVSQQCTDCNFD